MKGSVVSMLIYVIQVGPLYMFDVFLSPQSGDGHERRPYNEPGPANCGGEKSSPKNKVATKRLHGRLDDLEMAQALQMVSD